MQACHAGSMKNSTSHQDDAANKSEASDAKQRRRVPRKATPRHLENVALWYLARFQATSKSLEKVLIKRIMRSAQEHGTDIEEGRAFIGELLRRYQQAGLLDDAAYAAARTRTLHERGASSRAIRARLAEKGVGAADIEAAFESLAQDIECDGDMDLIAARKYVRRRRFGPWRQPPQRQERREKDLAALARAGFSYGVAKAVIDEDS
jgi:regulatory protein